MKIEVPCFRKTKGKIECVEFCEERLSCGHSCPLKCHYFKDRHHEKFRCKKPCAKLCPEGRTSVSVFLFFFCGLEIVFEVVKITILPAVAGHMCATNHECSTQCKKCVKVVERELPECGHTNEMFCFESVTKFSCLEQCNKKLLCGHLCRKKCSESCGPCKVQLTPLLHSIR